MEKIKFKDNDFEMNINFSAVDNSIWLCQKESAKFYEKSKSTITEHIKSIYDDKLLPNSTCRYFRQVKEENETIVNRKIKYHNLDLVLALGVRIGSNRGQFLKEFLENTLKPTPTSNCGRIIIYNNGKTEIPTNIDLKIENAWASVKQMAALYETTNQNIYKHINNIISEGEMNCFDEDSVFNH